MSSLKNLFLATRPNFLILTLLGCLIGLGIPSNTLASGYLLNSLAIIVAICAHAGANLLNDYSDHRNGSDENNSNRISPYTGGSRFIQNQTLSPVQIQSFAFGLLSFAAILGLIICNVTSWKLLPIGMLGGLMAWGYSAPPLQLMSRGIWGEIAITTAWSCLVLGMASIRLDDLALTAIPLAIAFGLMVANILLVNQIPDIDADRAAGKETLAVQYQKEYLWVFQLIILCLAYLLQGLSIHNGLISKRSAITLICLPGLMYCVSLIKKHVEDRAKLRLAIQINLLAVHAYALLLWASMRL